MTGQIGRHDTVTFPHGRVHWIVEHISPPFPSGRVSVLLKSGMTGRQRTAWLSDLTLHAKGTP